MRPPLRVSLRTSFIILSLIAAVMALIAEPTRRYLGNRGIVSALKAQDPSAWPEIDSAFGDVRFGYVCISNQVVDRGFVRKLNRLRNVRCVGFKNCTVDVAIIREIEASDSVALARCELLGSVGDDMMPYRMLMGVVECKPPQTVKDLIGKSHGGFLTLCPPDGEEYPWIKEIAGFASMSLPSRYEAQYGHVRGTAKYYFYQEE